MLEGSDMIMPSSAGGMRWKEPAVASSRWLGPGKDVAKSMMMTV